VRLLSHSWTRFFQRCKIVNRACSVSELCVCCVGREIIGFQLVPLFPPLGCPCPFSPLNALCSSKLNERTFSVGGVHQSCRA